MNIENKKTFLGNKQCGILTFHIERNSSDLGVGFSNNILDNHSDTILEEDALKKTLVVLSKLLMFSKLSE